MGLPDRKDVKKVDCGFSVFLTMALLSGSMNFEIMWCLWKWCAITVTISCVALKSMMSMTAGLSVVARLNSFASRLLSFAVVVTSSSQYVRMIHGTSRHTYRVLGRGRWEVRVRI